MPPLFQPLMPVCVVLLAAVLGMMMHEGGLRAPGEDAAGARPVAQLGITEEVAEARVVEMAALLEGGTPDEADTIRRVAGDVGHAGADDPCLGMRGGEGGELGEVVGRELHVIRHGEDIAIGGCGEKIAGLHDIFRADADLQGTRGGRDAGGGGGVDADGDVRRDAVDAAEQFSRPVFGGDDDRHKLVTRIRKSDTTQPNERKRL